MEETETKKKAEIPTLKISNQKDYKNIPFGSIFGDNMVVCEYKNGNWGEWKVCKYGSVSITPSIAALHYGQAIFEGMKAFRMESQQINIFRPKDHHKRFNNSAVRMSMPKIPSEIFVDSLSALIKKDRTWVPEGPNDALYIRPFMFASEEKIGISVSNEYIFSVITSPMGAFFSKPINVKIETEFTRAIEGGVGHIKCAGNYGAAMYPTFKAQKEGFDQIIWTDGKEHKYIEELGAAILFFVIDDVLVTPSPESETILKGITCNSVVQLAKNMGVTVEYRKISVQEVVEGIKSSKISEIFACGTALAVSPVNSISYKSKTYLLPPHKENNLGSKLLNSLNNIRVGISDDIFEWNHIVE